MSTVIKVDPEIMSGTPCFAGTRVPVKTLFDYLEGGHPLSEFYEQFPSVSRFQARSVLQLARHSVLQQALATA